jgi:hypothetical protein
MTTDTSDTGSYKPAASASKADHVEYAVQQGADRAAAEGMTKEQLRAQYVDNQPQAADSSAEATQATADDQGNPTSWPQQP